MTVALETRARSRVPSLGALVAWNAARRPDAPALREPDGPPIDHRALAGRVGAVATRLRDVGVVPGDVVAVLVSGVADHLVSTLAVSTVAAVAAPLDPARPDDELAAAVARIGARRVLADHGNGGRLPLERVAVGVAAGGSPVVVADNDFDAVQRLMPARDGAGGPVAVTNGAALWAQHAAIRELDLREGDAVRVRSVAELLARIDVDVLAVLAAGGTIVCGSNGPTACLELPAVVACDAVVGPLAVVDGGGVLLVAGDLDGRVGPDGTFQVRGPRSVGRTAGEWVDCEVAVVARGDGRLALAASALGPPAPRCRVRGERPPVVVGRRGTRRPCARSTIAGFARGPVGGRPERPQSASTVGSRSPTVNARILSIGRKFCGLRSIAVDRYQPVGILPAFVDRRTLGSGWERPIGSRGEHTAATSVKHGRGRRGESG